MTYLGGGGSCVPQELETCRTSLNKTYTHRPSQSHPFHPQYCFCLSCRLFHNIPIKAFCETNLISKPKPLISLIKNQYYNLQFLLAFSFSVQGFVLHVQKPRKKCQEMKNSQQDALTRKLKPPFNVISKVLKPTNLV